MTMKTMKFSLPDDLRIELRAAAKREALDGERASESRVIRKALRAYLNGNRTPEGEVKP